MGFKDLTPQNIVPESPEQILLDSPRRKISGVLYHQGEILKAYINKAITSTDVALQLPTGSGKTLVGLLIAEWRRRKFNEKVVYLCPTRQLVNQVVEQANEVYGLSVCGFTGSTVEYSAKSKADFQSGAKVAVTTYNSLFNSNPFFNAQDIIIVDDAHVAENYISSMWSVKIEISNDNHSSIHNALSSLLRPYLEEANFKRLIGNVDHLTDLLWVDKLPTSDFLKIKDQFSNIIDTHIRDLDSLKFSWGLIKDHLNSCNVYLSSTEILIRPLISPTWTHHPFVNAKQRIFMSATLGQGGDLERMTGRKKITRLPIPEGWEKQGIGRRFFLFPETSLEKQDVEELQLKLMKIAGRSLILIPNNNDAKDAETLVDQKLSFKVFNSKSIEDSKKAFIKEEKAVAIIANRYDGIDFPGQDCRLLLINGLPKATNLQERFIMSRMGASIIFNERIQTRVLQAIGRCTRSLEDYSAVIVSGDELTDYLINTERRAYLHPEIQAELFFGIEQSKEATIEDIVDVFKLFLENGKDWEKANSQILSLRQTISQKAFPAIETLEKIVVYEIDYQESMWQGDYEEALASAESILSNLSLPELRGYRALWHYLAGSAALLNGLNSKALIQFKNAKKAAVGIPWLVRLSKAESIEETVEDDKVKFLYEQIERVESILVKLGLTHSRNFDEKEKKILDGINSNSTFEQVQLIVGELLGFQVGKKESDASPDPWWLAGNICLVFEDHAGAKSESVLDATKARQVSTHPNWIKEKVTIPGGAIILPVLVTPVIKAKEGAFPHLNSVGLWNLEEYKKWVKNALSIIRELRTKFEEPGNLNWREQAAIKFVENNLDAESLFKKLSTQIAAKLLRKE